MARLGRAQRILDTYSGYQVHVADDDIGAVDDDIEPVGWVTHAKMRHGRTFHEVNGEECWSFQLDVLVTVVRDAASMIVESKNKFK